MEFRQAIGLLGIVIAAVAAQLNDQVVNFVLADIQGGTGISNDNGTWLRTLFVTAEVMGMAVSPALGIGLSFRRFALMAVATSLFPSLLMMLGAGQGGAPAPLLMLRFVQGLGMGFTIPLLLTIAIRVLGPDIRLYGLAVYAMTATLTPNLAVTLAALWVDGVRDWHWAFAQALPICAIAAVCIWWGIPQEPPKYDRLKRFDWPGFLLVAVGFGSLSIVLEQGDRLDWYNSPLIAILTLVAAVSLPALYFAERAAPVPLMRFDLLKRRNFAYAVTVLMVFLLVALSASQVPLTFLEQVRGYRPLQIHVLTLEVAASQIVLLPATAWLLDHRHVDARWVNAVGFACILIACYANAHVTSDWGVQEFMVSQAFQSIGFAFVVMPLLMIATNSIQPDEGPYGSALVNTPRAVAEGIGFWLLALITRWRGGDHRVRLVDLLGQNRLVLEQLRVLPPDPNSPAGQGAYGALNAELQRQVTTLTTEDDFILLGLLVVALLILVAILPQRTYPPRIALAKQ